MAISATITVSFSPEEVKEIDARVAELKLGERGRSKYFQMLREYDRVLQLRKHYHEADGDVHFFPEGSEYPMAAEVDEAATRRLEDKLRTKAPDGSAETKPTPPPGRPPARK